MDRGGALVPQGLAHLEDEPATQVGIQGAERLVEQQDGRPAQVPGPGRRAAPGPRSAGRPTFARSPRVRATAAGCRHARSQPSVTCPGGAVRRRRCPSRRGAGRVGAPGRSSRSRGDGWAPASRPCRRPAPVLTGPDHPGERREEGRLPAALGPTTATISLGITSNEMLPAMTLEPCPMTRLSAASRGSCRPRGALQGRHAEAVDQQHEGQREGDQHDGEGGGHSVGLLARAAEQAHDLHGHREVPARARNEAAPNSPRERPASAAEASITTRRTDPYAVRNARVGLAPGRPRRRGAASRWRAARELRPPPPGGRRPARGRSAPAARCRAGRSAPVRRPAACRARAWRPRPRGGRWRAGDDARESAGEHGHGCQAPTMLAMTAVTRA